jgi:uncharacterized protein YfdQ (DUF2303 family)
LTDRTEADAVAEIIRQTPAPFIQGPGWAAVGLLPGMKVEVIDESIREPQPSRSQGRITVYDAPSFLAAVDQRKAKGTTVTAYADGAAKTLTAVLDDDRGDLPGWRSYTVQLSLRPTKLWTLWRRNDNEGMKQDTFAEFLRDMARTITDPEPADFIEMSQNIKGAQSTEFDYGWNPGSGDRTQRLITITTVTATGRKGEVTTPETFTISVRLFEGDALPTDVMAEFRFRAGGQQMILGYRLLDADWLEEQRFEALVTEVGASSGAPTIVRGPEPRETEIG